VLAAVPAQASDVSRLQIHTVPQDKRTALVRELMTLAVPVYVQLLATGGTFGSGADRGRPGDLASGRSV